MKQPSAAPRITTLRKLVVNHRRVDIHELVLHLSKWVRRITSNSQLEHLELVMDGLEHFMGPYLNYRGLVEHVSHRHGGTIRILRLMHGYLDSSTVTLLCQKCSNLEDASLGVNMSTLVSSASSQHSFVTRTFLQHEFPHKAASLSKLRRVSFRVCNVKSSKVEKSFTDEVATEFFKTLKYASLRRLAVNEMAWEVSEND